MKIIEFEFYGNFTAFKFYKNLKSTVLLTDPSLKPEISSACSKFNPQMYGKTSYSLGL